MFTYTARLATNPQWRSTRHARYLLRTTTGVKSHSNRAFTTSIIHDVSQGFLDLALALPYSELVPSYSATIIATTVVTRLVLTVPFSIWVRYSLVLILDHFNSAHVGEETAVEG